MLLNFLDREYRRVTVPYLEISSIRENSHGETIIRCRDGEIITSVLTHKEMVSLYKEAIKDDIEFFTDEDEDI